MAEKTFTHDPDAVLDYVFDWSAWLDAGETITDRTLTPSAGITVNSDAESDGLVTVWVSGATKPIQRVTCHITTSAGRQDDRTIRFDVRDR